MLSHENFMKDTMRTAFLIIIMISAGILVYSKSFHAEMVLDDYVFIIENKPIHMTRFNWENIKKAAFEGHPRNRFLPKISFAINYFFNQLDPTGYHLTNLTIHLLNGLILFFLIRLTLRIYIKKPDSFDPEIVAFFAALLWMVQPVGTQAVTYLCQRMAAMVAFFYLLSLFFYAKARFSMHRNQRTFLVPCLYFTGFIFSGICSFATKENAGTLPLVIIIYEWFFSRILS
jgi:hypothetical protein